MNIRKIQREIEKRHDSILKELHAKPRKSKAVPATEKSNTDSVPTQEAVLIPPAAPQFTRAQIKERCKLAFVSGSASLPELSATYSIPYDTMLGWSSTESWGIAKSIAVEAVAIDLPAKTSNWLAQQQQEQIERSIKRALSLQCKADDAIKSAEQKDELTPQAVRDSATTEEKLDAIIRRNLSMDTQAQGGARLNLNVLGNVSLISPM